MRQAKRKKQKKINNLWAQIERIAKQDAFVLGQVWLSPNGCQYQVAKVISESHAAMRKLKCTQMQTCEISCNSPGFDQWTVVENSDKLIDQKRTND